MATWLRKCSGMTQEEVDALSMKIAMKQEQHLIPLKEDLADWLNKTLGGIDSSTPFSLFSSLWVVEDVNGRPFISYLFPKPNSSNCLLLAFGRVTGRNPPH
ncbi:hypothetical protein AVEN_18640-1 [Araneus ventricosus]|uniref:Uncharacterized protein n=1 Tax=Araneus ventricosus TaxID=182803 RepID=A0A4Y2MBZ8_ARAVE|nr:hypothetical protein AVEN_18640-1 [Araneus ventricosus]